MKKFVAGWLVGIASLCLAGAALTPTALQLVLNNTDIYSLEAGEGIYYVRLRPILFADPLCRRVDLSRYKEGPRFGWTSVASFIDMTYQYHSLKGNITSASPEITARCAEGWPGYHVQPAGTATTRPLYDGALWAASATWKQIGTVPVNTPCESAVIRKTTVEYHYTTNTSKLRGLAACAQGA